MNVVLRVGTAAGLGVDAYVHFHLASGYQLAAPGGVGGGTLFRVEAVSALVAAVFVLVRGTRRAFLVTASVALVGLVAVVLYRYVDVPAVGPLPSMYEPVWFFEKTLSAVAEAAAATLAAVGALSANPSTSTPRRGQQAPARD